MTMLATQPPSFENALAALHSGNLRSAEQILRKVVQSEPAHPHASLLLGQLLENAKNLDEAEEHFRRADLLNPSDASVCESLARVLRKLDRLDEAMACVRRGLQAHPNSAELHNSLGTILKAQGQFVEAIKHFSEATRLDRTLPLPHVNLGTILQQLGETDDAIDCFQAALNLYPPTSEAYERSSVKTIKFQMATAVPVIAQSERAIEQSRQAVKEALNQLQDEKFFFDPIKGHLPTVFHMGYHGWNDLEFQKQIAGFCRSASVDYCKGRTASQRVAGKTKIGFISAHLWSHTVGLLWEGLITHLSREKFEVEVFSLSNSHDAVTERIRQSADYFLPLQCDLSEACERIAERNLDISYYLDIGMDCPSYALANCRLAPVQCSTWGHPVTSGLPTVDYFISSQLFEEASADAHYSEQLVRLKSLGIYFEPPAIDIPPLSRGEFGLPEDKHLYGCLQSLFKMHPAFDRTLGEILRRDPEGVVVLLEGRHSNWTGLLLERFERSLGDVIDRLCFVPRQSSARYTRLVSLMNVLLDPPQFGGGKTSYEAFALGAPVVTMPSPYLKARLTCGQYKAMSISDCIAESEEEYVDIAVRLGTKPAFRAEISRKIKENCQRLFNDLDAVRELEDFFVSVAKG